MWRTTGARVVLLQGTREAACAVPSLRWPIVNERTSTGDSIVSYVTASSAAIPKYPCSTQRVENGHALQNRAFVNGTIASTGKCSPFENKPAATAFHVGLGVPMTDMYI